MAGDRARSSRENPPGRRLSLRTVLTCLVLALVALACGELSKDFLEHWRDYRQAVRVANTDTVIVHLVRGAQALAFERGRAAVLLRADGPAGAADRTVLGVRRATAEQEFAQGIQDLDESQAMLARRLSRDQERLTALRRRVDAQLALPLGQRDPDFPEQWFQTVSTMLASVPEGIFLLGQHQPLPPFARIALQAFDLRNILGIESSRLASALASGRVPSMDELAELARLRGQGDSAWANLRREVALSGNQPLQDALAKADLELLRTFRPVQDAVVTAFLDRRLPAQTVRFYTTASVPALDAVAEIMALAAQEGGTRAAHDRDWAHRIAMIYAATMALSFLLGGALIAVPATGSWRRRGPPPTA